MIGFGQGVKFYASMGWLGLGFTRLGGERKLKKVVESGCGLVRLWVQ